MIVDHKVSVVRPSLTRPRLRWEGASPQSLPQWLHLPDSHAITTGSYVVYMHPMHSFLSSIQILSLGFILIRL